MQAVKKGIDPDLFFIVIQINNFYKQTVLKSYILIATIFYYYNAGGTAQSLSCVRRAFQHWSIFQVSSALFGVIW